MRAGVICNGKIEDYGWFSAIAESLDVVVCADGGSNHAYYAGITPKMIVGDLDSIRPEVLAHFRQAGVLIKRYPREKDETDLRLALSEVVKLGAGEVVLLAALGKRVDHILGNISNLVYLHNMGVRGYILDENNQVFICDSEVQITGEAGEEVSLLPLTTRVCGLYSKNLKYPLQNSVFEIGNPYGISNVLLGKEASVSMQDGLLLVIKSRD